MCILKNLCLVIISILEESVGDNWRDWRPENEVLQLYKYFPNEHFKKPTFSSRRTEESKRSPNKKNTASGTARTSFGLERTSRPTSLRAKGDLKRSVRNTAMAGSTLHTVRMIFCQTVSVSPRSVAPIISGGRLTSFVGLFQTDNRNNSDSVSKRKDLFRFPKRVS